jgi:hypothetical protein
MLGENTVEPGVSKAASSPTSPVAGKQELLHAIPSSAHCRFTDTLSLPFHPA